MIVGLFGCCALSVACEPVNMLFKRRSRVRDHRAGDGQYASDILRLNRLGAGRPRCPIGACGRSVAAQTKSIPECNLVALPLALQRNGRALRSTGLAFGHGMLSSIVFRCGRRLARQTCLALGFPPFLRAIEFGPSLGRNAGVTAEALDQRLQIGRGVGLEPLGEVVGAIAHDAAPRARPNTLRWYLHCQRPYIIAPDTMRPPHSP